VAEDENMEDPTQDRDDERIELTPGQEETLRQAAENIRRALSPKDRLPAFRIPRSTLMNIAAISRIADAQQVMVSSAIKPILDAQSAWQRQFAVVNSDIFRSTGLAQSNLNLIASQLTKNMDFGISESMAKIAAQFAAQQESWLKTIGPALASLKLAVYPPNLRTIEDLKFEEVEQVVMVDGIPLYGVPRTSTAEALVRADGANERRDILGRRWKTISADCRECVEGCTSESVATYVPFAVAALDALEAGHTEAAQALAGSLVDAILSAYFGKDRYNFTPDKKGKRTKDAYNEFSVRRFIAFAPMWQTYQLFWVEDGDPVPTTFSRNATAHTVSRKQFNRRNAVQGLMVACSLIYRLDEETAVVETQ
jgi:hypothetical protein